MYKQIECPTCGNVITAKSIDEPQKCKWCRRLFKVTVIRRNKQGRKGKYNWSAESVDFPAEGNSYSKEVRSMTNYMDKDIYG